MASWALCTAMASWAPSSAMASFVCLFRSGGPRPVFLSVFVLRGLQSAHPPSPVELLRCGTRLPGGGSYVRVLLCVSSVPASCVHIWFVSCPRLVLLLVNSCPAVCMWLCVNYPVYISPVFWVCFRLVYSLLPRCILSLSPALSYLDVSLKTIIWVYVLVCVFLFLPHVCTVTEDGLAVVSDWDLSTAGFMTALKSPPTTRGQSISSSRVLEICVRNALSVSFGP